MFLGLTSGLYCTYFDLRGKLRSGKTTPNFRICSEYLSLSPCDILTGCETTIATTTADKDHLTHSSHLSLSLTSKTKCVAPSPDQDRVLKQVLDPRGAPRDPKSVSQLQIPSLPPGLLPGQSDSWAEIATWQLANQKCCICWGRALFWLSSGKGRASR